MQTPETLYLALLSGAIKEIDKVLTGAGLSQYDAKHFTESAVYDYYQSGVSNANFK